MKTLSTWGHGLLLLAIALLTLRCVPTPTPAPTSDPLDAVRAHIDAGEYTAAEAILRATTQTPPDGPQPYLELAALYRTWNRPIDGLRALDAATRNSATANHTAHLRLDLLTMARNWPQAIIEAEEQLAVAPTDPVALRALTQSYLHQHQCAAATETAQRWRVADAADLEAAKTYGILASDAASLCEADATLCALVDAQAYTRLGLALIHTGDWALAAYTLDRAIAEETASAETYTWLGEALIRPRHPKTARDHLITATTLAPESPLPWTLLGTYYIQQQEIAAAQEVLFHAHHLDPANPAPCLMIAAIKAQAGQYDQIAIWLEAATNAAPDDAAVWQAVARFYLERHLVDDQLVSDAVQRAVQIAPDDNESHLLLGWLHLQRGETSAALTALDEAIALAPDLGQAYYLRGQALLGLDDRTNAQTAFNHAADLGYWP